jgi:hypothetical protein
MNLLVTVGVLGGACPVERKNLGLVAEASETPVSIVDHVQ